MGPEEATLVQEFRAILQEPVQVGRLRNALQHMWGYLSDKAPPTDRSLDNVGTLYEHVVEQTIIQQPLYLLHSTALSDLGAALMQVTSTSKHEG